MSQFPDDAELSSADEVVERALASVSHPDPRPEFLSALRDRFTTVATAGVESSADDARHSASLPFAPRRAGRRLPPLALAAGILVVASAAFAVWSFAPRDAAHWAPVDGHLPAAPVLIDGRSVLADSVSRSVADGAVAHTIATGAESLWLRLGDRVMFELAPATEIELGPLPRGGEPLALATRKGSLRLCTGKAFVGSRLDVSTPNFDLVVTGCSFAIDVDVDGTCVCCLDGPVVVKTREAPTWTVESGRMCRIYNDGRAPKWDALSEKHGPPLERFDELADELMD